MRLVVDASVAVKWMFEEPGSDAALRLAAASESLVAPDLVLVECASAAWKRLRRGEIGRDHAAAAIASWPDWFDDLLPSGELVAEAFVLARDLDHPIYDCLYLAAAAREDVSLVTADARLLSRAAGTSLGVRVQSLSEIQF